MPLSDASLNILLALAGGERHGYAIMREVNSLGPGTLYRTIQSLTELGYITESDRRPDSEEDQRRRYYRLTTAGRRVVTAEMHRLADVVARARDLGILPARGT